MLFTIHKIRNNSRCFSIVTLLKTLLLCVLGCTVPYQNYAQTPQDDLIFKDSIVISPAPMRSDSVAYRDSVKAARLDSLKKTADLKSKVQYKAKDSIAFDIQNRFLYLYGDVLLEYEDITLKAEKIWIDWGTTTMFAEGIQDSTGKWVGQPVFEEGDQTYNAEALAFNFNTRKGRILGGRTQQDDNFVLGDSIKRNPDNSYFIRSGKITTCNLEDPHFYIYSDKMKVIPNDKIITGRVNMVVEKVPVPLVLPFGFFPNKKGKKSGILMPSYGNDATRGFFLRDGGYYLGRNDYVDLSLRGDIFSYGSYRVNATSRYNWNYHFNGSLDVKYAMNNSGEKTDLNYSESRDFFVVWRHDQKIGNTSRLSSDVNLGSSNFLKLNSLNTNDIVTNQLMSNVAWSKTFANTPWSMNARLGHQQNTNTKAISLEMPSIGINRGRTFPFKRKSGGGKERFYEKIGYSYSAQAINRINTFDSLLFKPGFEKGFQNGIRHTIPVSMNLKALKYVTVSPGLNFNEYWYLSEVRDRWQDGFVDTGEVYRPGRVVKDTINQFLSGRDFSASVTASTRIYGMFPFPSKRQRIIRHTFTPNVGYTFKPDFSKEGWGYFYKVQQDSIGTIRTVSRFADRINGGPSAGEQQQLSFGFLNLLEMKYWSQKKGQDTLVSKPESKKLTLLDNFGMQGNYNFAADSLNLSPLNFSARTVLLNNLLNVNLTAVMDPYQQDASGRKINQLRWEKDRKPGYITTSNLAISTSFRSKKEKARVKPKNLDPALLAEIERNRELYADFNIPWSLNLSYNLLYNRQNINQNSTLNQSVQIGGDLNLTEKWKIRVTTGYDFVAKDVTLTQFNIMRDLHCWEAAFSWTPFGTRKFYMLTINAKSSTLQDLKLTKQSPPNFRNLLN